MKYKMVMIIVIMGLALGGVSITFGGNSYMTPFNTANGTTYNCGVCHTTATASSSARNSFGADWSNASIGNHSYTITSALANRDSDGDSYLNGAEILAKTNPGDATSFPTGGTADTTAPTVNSFTIPATAGSLTVSPISITASDNTGGSGVNGYIITTTATAPSATATGWSATAPNSYSFPAGTSGSRTLYAWAKDVANNVSASRSAAVTITITTTDTIAPTVNTFSLPPSAGSLTVSPIAISAVDNAGGSGVNGYMVTATATAPSATATGWSTTAPTNFSFPAGTTSGVMTLYAWAKDVAGNVSTSRSATVNITTGSEIDVESPEVMEFTLPLTSTSPTVPILAFRAIDNVEATEHLITYLITTTSAAPAANAAGWSTTPPASYTFPSGGSKTLYGWAKDAAGNISESVWDNVDIIAAGDQTPPVVTYFSIPSTSRTFAVLIRRFTATDNTAVTGYLVTTSSTKPGASDPNWRSTPPTSYTFSSTGRKRLYAWAKDAAGNVSSASRGTVMVLGNNQEVDD